MRVAHVSDIHYAPETLAEVDRCFSHAVDMAIAAPCEAAVLSGDLFDHRVDLHSPAVGAVVRQVRRLADHMPVLILQGTFSHDAPGSLEIFRHLGGCFPVHVADRIGQVALIGRRAWEESNGWAFDNLPACSAIFSCLPPVNKGALAAEVGPEHAAAAVGEHVYALLKGWAPAHLQARQSGIPSIVVSHGTVSGCVTEHGVPMAGLDYEYTVGSLFAAEASAVMLGHIHQYQVWEREGRRIAYPGSVGRLHFGEISPKGFLIWEVRPDHATAHFQETPAKRLLQIDFDGLPDMDHLAEQAAAATGAHVRIRFSVDEEHRHAVDKAAIKALFAKAAECKIEGRVNPIQRTRSEGINRATTLGAKIERWCSLTGTEHDPLLQRLAMLEHLDPEAIVRSVLETRDNADRAA